MARSYYSTSSNSRLTRSGTLSETSTAIPSGSMAREKVKSRQASRVMQSVPCATFCIKTREYARDCSLCPMSSGRRPTNLLTQGRYRCKITGQPCGSCPSLTAIERSWSGGQRSIANLSAARSRLGSFANRSRDGWARCGGCWMHNVPAARLPSPSRAA